jgi:hypothetical protein
MPCQQRPTEPKNVALMQSNVVLGQTRRKAKIKQEFLKVAEQWETLAREIEDIERMRVFTMTTGRAQNPPL